MGAGPWLPVGVGWLGGRLSRSPSSALERTPCQGKRGGARCGAVYVRVGDACGWWRARSAVPFPAGPDPGGVVVMLVVRVVCVPEWLIVSVAVLLARLVWVLA